MSQSLNATPLRRQKPRNRAVIALTFARRERTRVLAGVPGHPLGGFHIFEIDVFRRRQARFLAVGHLHHVQCRCSAAGSQLRSRLHLVVGQEIADDEHRRGAMQMTHADAELGALAAGAGRSVASWRTITA